MVVFRVGARRYAIAVEAVLAVGETGAAKGAASWRGREVPVLEPGPLGLGERAGGEAVLVVSGAGEPQALRVDAVEGIVAAVEVREWPALLAPVVGPGFPGVATGSGGDLIVVDAGRLLAAPAPGGGRAPQEEAGETA